jgi:hypothetical protein
MGVNTVCVGWHFLSFRRREYGMVQSLNITPKKKRILNVRPVKAVCISIRSASEWLSVSCAAISPGTYYLSNRILASAADGRRFGKIPASAGPEFLDRFCNKVESCSLHKEPANKCRIKLWPRLISWRASICITCTDLIPPPSVKLGDCVLLCLFEDSTWCVMSCL